MSARAPAEPTLSVVLNGREVKLGNPFALDKRAAKLRGLARALLEHLLARALEVGFAPFIVGRRTLAAALGTGEHGSGVRKALAAIKEGGFKWLRLEPGPAGTTVSFVPAALKALAEVRLRASRLTATPRGRPEDHGGEQAVTRCLADPVPGPYAGGRERRRKVVDFLRREPGTRSVPPRPADDWLGVALLDFEVEDRIRARYVRSAHLTPIAMAEFLKHLPEASVLEVEMCEPARQTKTGRHFAYYRRERDGWRLLRHRHEGTPLAGLLRDDSDTRQRQPGDDRGGPRLDTGSARGPTRRWIR